MQTVICNIFSVICIHSKVSEKKIKWSKKRPPRSTISHLFIRDDLPPRSLLYSNTERWRARIEIILLGSQMKAFHFLIRFVNLTSFERLSDILVPLFTHLMYRLGKSAPGEQSRECTCLGVHPLSVAPAWLPQIMGPPRMVHSFSPGCSMLMFVKPSSPSTWFSRFFKAQPLDCSLIPEEKPKGDSQGTIISKC